MVRWLRSPVKGGQHRGIAGYRFYGTRDFVRTRGGRWPRHGSGLCARTIGAHEPQPASRWCWFGAGRLLLATIAAMNTPTPLPLPLATAYSYQRRTPETSLLRRIVMAQWPRLERDVREATDGRGLPRFIRKAVDGFIKCGMLGHGFLRLFCKSCKTDQLVAFSCKVRGLCSRSPLSP